MLTRELLNQLKEKFEIFYVAVSVGKDSTATLLWCIENIGKEKLFVAFADTGHEARATYKYINYLEEVLKIKINRYFPQKNFYQLVEHKKIFPSKSSRYCTEYLKKSVRNKVLTELINKGYEKICIVTGVRADESEQRSKYPVYEEEREIGILRPILHWTEDDVFRYIHEKGLKVNPLYQKGCDRVGCFPCIFASPQEVVLLYEDPAFQDARKKIEFLERKIARPFFITETLRERYERIKSGKYRQRKKEKTNVCNISGISMCE